MYLLPLNKSMTFLEVYQVANSVKTLLWNLTGYHGKTWLEGRIPLRASQPFKVEFYGEGDINGTVNVAITDIKVSTMMCTLTPSYGKPGFQCKDNKFQCKNKQCVDKHLKCNGDRNCIDGSDEDWCCPTNKFLCSSGKCISTNSLCDGQNDCKDSADEDHCDRGCKEFQCASGSCLKWSSTCTDKGTCPEQSSNPKICGNNHCPLNNIGCLSNQTDTNNDESVCRTFIGPCSFNNGDLCGLTHDQDAAFLWTFKSDETQTPSTGPQTDHTQMSEEGGTYIYTEASSRRPGDKARLVSGWLSPNNPLCLQFWYHMYGNHIGSLKILVHTNYSEQVVWELHGNQDNIWRFGQTALNSTSKYKFVLEGETTGGIEGDIAIDDVTLYDGSCQTILSQQTSPSCGFEHDSCGWTSSSGWIRASSSNKFSKSMVYDGRKPSSLVSPLINHNESEWRCFRFWYLTYRQNIEQHSINVSMESLGKNKLLLVIEQLVKDKWQFVQLPLPQGKTFKISISATLAVSIDEISFTKDTCQPIPWDDTSKGVICKNTSNEWCSWKVNETQNNISNTWVMTSQPVLYSYYKEHNITKPTEYDVISHEYEIILKSNLSLNLPGAETVSQLTLCWWLKTFNQGFRVLYSNDFERETDNGGITITISDQIMAEIMNTVLTTKVDSLFNNNWHFYCFTWSGSKPEVQFYLDGVFRGVSSLAMQNSSSLAGGGKLTLSIPYNASSQGNWGFLSLFNVWSTILTPKVIKMFSLGCGEERGNIIRWNFVLTEVDPDNRYRQLSSCEDAKGDRMVLKGNTTSFLISRVNYRSYTSSQVCFIFRYMMYGADVDSLTMFVRHDNQSDLTPIWVDSDGNSNEWRYGQVQVTAMDTFQIYFRGKVKGRLGYIAVGTTHFNEGDCTNYRSLRKFRVFSKTIKEPGYITSPFYPGYYIRDIEYRWYIKAPKNHVLRITFLDFLLESDITCSKDYVQVYDGKESTAVSLGKFCGFVYPQFIMTTTNEMTVIFHSNINGAVRRGFKASLQFIQDQSTISGKKCTRRKGCPSSCECIIVQNKNRQHKEKIMIQGKLYLVPENMPTSTFALMFGNGYLNELKAFSFNELPSLLYVDLTHNVVVSINDDAFVNATSLETLRLNSNFITFARNPPKKPFRHLRELITLDLGYNLLTTLPEDVFFGLSSLKVLGLRSNGITKIPPRLFYNTENLTHLYLQDNLITTLPDYGFKSLSNLQLLNLGNNRITELRRATFDGLTSLKHLNLSNNKLTHVSIDAFEDLDNLEYLELDRFILCCYAEKAIGGLQKCKSPTNGFSSCDDLMKNQVLRVCIWILGLSALIGNAFVIVWRVGENQKHGQVHSMLLTNLAVADFLMGVYLITIASMDMKWKGEYFKHDIEWRSGIGCRLTGMISMLSSEVSVAMLAVVTCDRLICIVFPFSSLKITRRKGIFICVITWIVFLSASVIPIFGLNYFSTDNDDFGFYGRSSVCLPMQLSADRPAGWEYSVVIFVVFNFLSFSFMLGAYIAIYVTVKKSALAIRSTSDTVKRESALARKAIFIITTDFLCWIPVIIISLLSLTGAFEDPSKQVYAWIAVFVLPLNSSINPFLYTFSSIQLKKELVIKKKRLSRLITKAGFGQEPRHRAFSCDSIDDMTAVSEVMTMSNKHGFLSPNLFVSRRPSSVSSEISNHNGAHLTLIDRCKILEGGKGIGYVLAMVRSELCMIKYFSQNMKDTWDKEVSTVTALKDFSDKRVICAYKWHSQGSSHTIDDTKIKISNLDKSLLICYSYVSRTSLQDYMDSEHPLMFSVVCALAIDVITALGYLHEKKICHNNINTRTILVTDKDDPIRAVLADFSNSCKVSGTNNSYLSDIRQFGQLLKMLAIQCEDFTEYKKINDLMYTSLQEGKQNTATVIKGNLVNLKNEHEGICDTSL